MRPIANERAMGGPTKLTDFFNILLDNNMVERTLAIIKPDAVKKGAVGDIIKRYEAAALRPVAIRMVQLTKAAAEEFYVVHRNCPFFDSLTTFMASGPIVVLVLMGDDAVKRHRDLMGATDPAKADPGTIRAQYGSTIESNAVHGSDSAETADFEIRYFFSETGVSGP